jgi:hypothetical protein
MPLAWSAALVIVLLLGPASTVAAECGCLRLRTFTAGERAQLETQYGLDWWRALGLIPGPATADDYVERPFGDSSRTVYIPQRFWDPRACGPGPDRPHRPGPTAK